MSITSQLLGDLGPIEGKLADLVLADVKANEATILARAGALNITAANAVVTVVCAALPKNGIFALIAPSIRKALDNASPEIVAALGGEEQTLLKLVETAIGTFAAAHGG